MLKYIEKKIRKKENKEKLKEYREANKDKIKKYQKEYYEANKEKLRKANRERMRQYRLKHKSN